MEDKKEIKTTSNFIQRKVKNFKFKEKKNINCLSLCLFLKWKNI